MQVVLQRAPFQERRNDRDIEAQPRGQMAYGSAFFAFRMQWIMSYLKIQWKEPQTIRNCGLATRSSRTVGRRSAGSAHAHTGKTE